MIAVPLSAILISLFLCFAFWRDVRNWMTDKLLEKRARKGRTENDRPTQRVNRSDKPEDSTTHSAAIGPNMV